ncbi:hypothetical protein [Fundidesulfovibrio agrisoli]|uniref:hypothetical protein n=1 Tax=Fundidesulfovibrio agrisoli TaxID=2922717 RepID=UPI001FADE4AE|nr:hypothetical protein [Fundidesulfovibrio agrisoli]
MKKYLLLLPVAALLASFSLTIFVIPPIGGLPDGRTLVILKREKTRFIDSPDAFCVRERGGVSPECRAAALGGILDQGNGPVLLTLPYSRWLYLMSTDGAEFER